MWWFIGGVLVFLVYLFVWTLVKVAGDADRRAEEEFYRNREWNDENREGWY
jgi:hypothetical protein